MRDPRDLVNHPARGQIFESFVLSELLKSFAHRGETPPLYFWRDRTGHEVDFIVDYGTDLVPIEAKSGETISASFFDGLRYFTRLGTPASQTGLLIHGGSDLYERDGFSVRPRLGAV